MCRLNVLAKSEFVKIALLFESVKTICGIDQMINIFKLLYVSVPKKGSNELFFQSYRIINRMRCELIQS